MSDVPTRLDRAMDAWVRFSATPGASKEQWIAANPDLADLLEAMFDGDLEPAASAVAAGRTLGDFSLLREVGRGGMGVVYEARQLSLDRRVALKLLPPEVTSQPSTLARFRREARTLARLDHPHVVGIVDVGESDGVHWLAMEFVDGESLDRHLERLRQQGHQGDSLRRLVEVIAEIAEALHHAHGAGILHRDVKPSNILLRPAAAGAVLTDFGLARDEHAPAITASGMVAGTPHYMSPEQARAGGVLDARSDVFALGTTLYECITLRRPFDGANTEQVLHRIGKSDPVDPRRLRPGLPLDLAAIVMKALEKNPAHRYATALAMAEDLRAFLALRPVQARPTSTLVRLQRWIRREPVKAVLGAALAGVMALAAILLLRLPEIRAGQRAQRQQEYEDAMVRGFTAQTSDDAPGARAHFERALGLAPQRAEAAICSALALRKASGAAAALAEVEQRAGAVDLAADGERLRAVLLRDLGRTAEAAAIERALAEPRTPTGLWLAAAMDTEHGDAAARRGALQRASFAVRIAPAPRLMVWLQWAACANAVRDAAAMAESAQALLALWPDNPTAMNYAVVNLMHSLPERAAEVQRRALALGLQDRYGEYNLGAALTRAGRHQEAVPHLRAACTANPGKDLFRVQLIDTLHEAGDTAGEGAECERWLAEAPDNLNAKRKLAQFLGAAEQYPRALELMRDVARARPDNAEVQYDLAVVLDSAGDTRGARQQLLAVLALDARNDRAHDRLLRVLRDLDDADAMLAELARFAKARGDDAEAWATYARGELSVAGQGSLERALAAATRADYLARGENAGFLFLRADILERQGDTRGATALRALADGCDRPK